MVSHQLVRGLEDASIQEKVLALAATDKDLNLKKITEFVLAQESGTRSSKLLGEVAGVSNICVFHGVAGVARATPGLMELQSTGKGIEVTR